MRNAIDRWRLAGVVSLGILAAFMVMRAGFKVRGVILRNREFGGHLLDGDFLYEGTLHSTYPPCWAVAMAPLAWMPVPAARIFWAILQVVAIWLAARILKRMFEDAGRSTKAFGWVYLLGILGISRFLVRDFSGGGPAFLLFTAVLAGLSCHMRGKDLRAGAFIGAAAALKMTAGLFLVYFLWKRQWRTAGAAIATVAVLFVVPLPFLGWETFILCYRTWITSVLEFMQIQDLHDPEALVPFTWMNQSLKYALYRFLVASDFDHPLFVNFFRFSPATATWIIRGITLGIICWLGWITRRPIERRSTRFLIESSIIFAFSALLSPIAWRTYFVVLLPALVLLVSRAIEEARTRRWLIPGLTLYLLLTVGMNQELWGDELKEVLQAYYTVTWAALLAVGLTLLYPTPEEP